MLLTRKHALSRKVQAHPRRSRRTQRFPSACLTHPSPSILVPTSYPTQSSCHHLEPTGSSIPGFPFHRSLRKALEFMGTYGTIGRERVYGAERVEGRGYVGL